MPTHVYANNNEIASKAADGKSIAAFPDVCFTPPAPPVGPLPLPYPNTGEVKDTDKGTTKVFIKDKMVGMEGDSYISKSMGDEAATQSQGKGIITGALQGKCYFGVWSMDVKMEGKGAPRHLDMVTHNHGSMVGQAVKVDLDNVSSGKNAPKPTVVANRHCCYSLKFVDRYDNEIAEEHFASGENNYFSQAKIQLTNLNDSQIENFKQHIKKHDTRGVLTLAIKEDYESNEAPENFFPFKIMYANTFEKDNKFGKQVQNKTALKAVNLKYYDAPTVIHRATKSCDSCDGKMDQITVRLVPEPFFPKLISGPWNQTTAYNLSVLSDIAYSDFDLSEKKTYFGSIKSMFRNLCVSCNASNCGKDYFFTESIEIKDNYLNCKVISNETAFCYILENKDKIVFAFRGSHVAADYKADAKIRLENYEYGGYIHRGFHQYYNMLREKLISYCKDIGKKEIFITGHSLGGALALIHAASLKRAYKDANINLYTYGMPRVFDSQAIRSIEDISHFRHVYEADLVPRIIPSKLPNSVQDFLHSPIKDGCTKFTRQHHGQICYIERDKTSFKKFCDEWVTSRNVVTGGAKKSADATIKTKNYTIYFFKEKNRNYINSNIINFFQNMKSKRPISGVVLLGYDLASTHSMKNYISSLKQSCQMKIVIGEAQSFTSDEEL